MKANRVRLFAPPLLLTLPALACPLPGKPQPLATPTLATAATAGLAAPTGAFTAVPANTGGCDNPASP